MHHRASDEVGIRMQEIFDRVRDMARFADAAERHDRRQPRQFRRAQTTTGHHRRVDGAWGDSVDAYTLRRPLERQVAAEVDDAGLGRRVGRAR